MKRNKKYLRIVDICLQLTYTYCSGVFFYNEMRSTGSGGGDSNLIVLFFIIPFIFVNSFFFFIQLFIDSIKWKKYVFILHNLCLFGFNFYLEIQWSMDWNNGIKVWKTSPWLFYIPLFILVSSCIYICLVDCIFNKNQESIIFNKLVNRINRLFPKKEDE